MPRCSQSNKFVAMSFEEPELNEISVDADGRVTASVRLVRTCEECGEEMKEATLDLETEVDIDKHKGEGHELSVEEDSVEQIEEGGGRYKKSYFGATVDFTVTCSCDEKKGDKRWSVSGSMDDKVPASGMDNLVD